jgi:acetate kinase
MIGIGFIDDLISEVGMPLVKKGVKALTGIDLESKELTNEDKQKIMDSQIEIMKIDEPYNATIRGKETIISTADSKVKVVVIPTDEEFMIASDTMTILKK